MMLKKSTALAILACLAWSTAFVGIKIGLRYSTPLHLAGIRFMLSGIMVLLFCRDLKANLRLLWHYKIPFLRIAFFQTFGLYSLFHYGISLVPASVTALIIGAGPLFIAIFAWLLNGESFSKRKAYAIIAGFLGIGVIALGRFGGLISTEISLLGVGILLVANISGSLGNIYISKSNIPVNPVFVNAIQLFVGGFGILIVSFFFEGFQFGIQPIAYYFALIWLSLIAALGFSLWFIVLKMPGIKVSEINVWKFIIPVLGAILSWIILPDEKPEIVVFSGMILVGMSLVIMFYKPGKLKIKK